MFRRTFTPLLSSLVSALGLAGPVGVSTAAAAELRELRPPAVPLVACDPYFSVWSNFDRLTDGPTRHWTGRKQSLSSMIRLDGKSYRLMGDEPKEVTAYPQLGLRVLPTRTIYDFEGPEAHITLTFTTPALPDDLDVLSRPITYLSWDVRSRDGKQHQTQIYFAASAELAVNTPDQRVAWSREAIGGLTVLKIGTEEQAVLRKRGDDLRIDWGHAYAATGSDRASAAIGADREFSGAFTEFGKLPLDGGSRQPRAANDDSPTMAFELDLGMVGAEPVSRHLILAYDDGYSITYFRRNLRPYWRRQGAEAADLLKLAEADYEGLVRRCRGDSTTS